MAGCVGVAGSARIGANCTVGGGAVVLGHLTLADGVHISAASVVMRSIHQPGQYSGVFPIDDNRSWKRTRLTLRQLHRLRDRIKALENNHEDGHQQDPQAAAAPLSLPARRPRARGGKWQVHQGAQECQRQRAAVPGHFPNRPVFPGVLQLEALAQAAALLAFETLETSPSDDTVYYFAGIDGARFKRPVEPGDQLILEVTLERMRGHVQVQGRDQGRRRGGLRGRADVRDAQGRLRRTHA